MMQKYQSRTKPGFALEKKNKNQLTGLGERTARTGGGRHDRKNDGEPRNGNEFGSSRQNPSERSQSRGTFGNDLYRTVASERIVERAGPEIFISCTRP
ncbi:hypothetical protein K0M31_003542 [Melipona bicolor]|uniref:Uncharacterized protein n=1 Tax=Melipona bicolor TaxID=60889 RepID=A0AA40FZE6_9HYME|nr:hypothetical protein K0M31_003542 [Melipona bicolor]